ncbi:MAG: calcium/proton exchanger [Anaerolineae bacterium]|nr:MAG: calcium/proton exchanger [Anaerolineae bacterium]
MRLLLQVVQKNPLYALLLAFPLALLGEYWLHWSPLLVFILAAAAVIPLASLIGTATEALAHYTGPRIGGLLNATLGNAAELIITIVAIRAGLLELVKASITGSILGNLLLVMGLSMLYGGVRNGVQKFSSSQAGRNAILLVLATLAMLIPSLFSGSIGDETSLKVEALSVGVAVVMITLYGLGLLYSLRDSGANEHHTVEAGIVPHWSLRTSLVVLALVTAGIVWMSEVLVGVVEPVVASLGVSEFFLGVILVPLIGNVAEHLVAVELAGKNKMDISVEIAVSSSLQIALLVAPLLVFLSLMLGHPLQLIFNNFELLALMAGVVISAMVSFDGESNWLEGAALLGIYIILGLAFFLLP